MGSFVAALLRMTREFLPDRIYSVILSAAKDLRT